MLWNAVIFGPHDTPFEDGTFKLTIEFTEEYPNKPPTVRYNIFYPLNRDDNNLGPDRLAGPKALDPNYCRQPTL